MRHGIIHQKIEELILEIDNQYSGENKIILSLLGAFDKVDSGGFKRGDYT